MNARYCIKVTISLLILLSFFPFIPKVKANTTETFYIDALGDDGYVWGQDASYPIAHITAFSYYASSTAYEFFIGQKDLNVPYYVYRTFLKFDTSAIPSGASITSASLLLYGKTDTSEQDFIIQLQKWTGDTPIDTGDYNQFDGVNYDDGEFDTSGFISDAYNTITISNFDLITKEGNTLICVRSNRDISETPPSKFYHEYVAIGSSKYSPWQPKLEVTWTVEEEKEWHDISTWNFNLFTRQWSSITSWNFNLSTMQWNSIATWSFQTITRIWKNITNWVFDAVSVGWHSIAHWIFTISTTKISVLLIGMLFMVSIMLIVFAMALKKTTK